MKLNMLLAMVVMSSISLSAMEERELVVAPGKSKEATKQLHCYFDDVRHNPAVQAINLYNKIEQLLKEGADPNAEYSEGYPILQWVSLNCRNPDQKMVPPSLIPLLVQYGAEIDRKCGREQINALHIVPFYELLEVDYDNKAHMLLQCGADVNCKDGAGGTPLSRRAYFYSVAGRLFKLLLIYGADPFIKDHYGYNALARIAEQRRSTCLTLHAQAQALLAFKEVAAKKGERYVRNADGKFVGKRDENGAVQLKTVHMDNLSIPIIKNIFEQAGFVYPHRQNIKVINVQVKEQSLTTSTKDLSNEIEHAFGNDSNEQYFVKCNGKKRARSCTGKK